jgi:hypothetical protein
MNAPAPVLAVEAPEVANKHAGPAKRTDGLSRAAQALLEAWNGLEGRRADVDEIIGPIAALRAAMAASASAHRPIDRASLRPDTKQA